MKLVDTTEVIAAGENLNSEITLSAEMSSSVMPSSKAYHELAEQTVQDMDVLKQLHANIEMLADLQGRLSFVMREVKYLSKA